jgi:hypothetical protein
MTQQIALAAEQANELPLSPEMFGVVALVAFIALLGLTWTFRGSSNKHR